jgi:hypothetical protein
VESPLQGKETAVLRSLAGACHSCCSLLKIELGLIKTELSLT